MFSTALAKLLPSAVSSLAPVVPVVVLVWLRWVELYSATVVVTPGPSVVEDERGVVLSSLEETPFFRVTARHFFASVCAIQKKNTPLTGLKSATDAK